LPRPVPARHPGQRELGEDADALAAVVGHDDETDGEPDEATDLDRRLGVPQDERDDAEAHDRADPVQVTVRQGLLQVIELGLIETRRGRGGGSLVATTSTMEASLRRVAVTRGAGSAATGVPS
jgi:hypothetical protein